MGRAGEGREASPSPACPRTESFENPGHGRASRACTPFLAFTAEAGYGEAPSPGRHMLPGAFGDKGWGRWGGAPCARLAACGFHCGGGLRRSLLPRAPCASEGRFKDKGRKRNPGT